VPLRNGILKAKFKHKGKNDVGKYDYIKKPKSSGYRGIHDVYEYNPKSKLGRTNAGLLIELQYRTLPQHAWATAVEVVSRITENQPKFDRGDERYKEFFRLSSEIIACAHEGLRSSYGGKTDAELLAAFKAVDNDIHIVRMLRELHTIYEVRQKGGNIILQFSPDGRLAIHELGDDKDVTAEYFRLEKANPGDDIVLVNTDTFAEIRSAYRNYFSDPSEFLRYLDEGCLVLGGETIL
jgi:putative GTP pyrophosphokinase